MTVDERIKEIEDLIESYVTEINLCEQAAINGANELEQAYDMGSIKSAYEAIIEEIKDFGAYMLQVGANKEDVGAKIV